MTALHRAALANNLMLFFASLAFAGLLIAVFNDPMSTIESASISVTESQEAEQGRAYIMTVWDLMPFIVSSLGS